MAKIVIIGAGSGFGSRLSIDIMSRESLRDSTIALCDIHPGRLEQVRAYVQRTAEKYKLNTRVVASTDRREVLPGADFVITSVAVGGHAYAGFPFKAEVEIPLKYGVNQSVADTVSTGAVFRFLRTGPVQQQFFADMEELCPNAQVLNHTNPMCMLSWLHLATSKMRYVGLCHGVQDTSKYLAKALEVPYEELRFQVAGINHLAWFLDLRHGTEDLYPRLRALGDHPEAIKGEEVRFEILRNFGYFSTESNRHDSEYMPYFRRTPELMEHYHLDRRPVADQPGHAREWMADGVGDAAPVGELQRSHEYTTAIMEAILTNVPFAFNGNVRNDGLISNLPEGCCVEVPCLVDANGVTPCHMGALPPQLAALDRSNVAVQELAVRAVLDRDREAAFHACALDPLTAAALSLPKIREMFDEMWEAEKNLLKWFDPKHKGPLPEICGE
jgi:alpha-galactosidase